MAVEELAAVVDSYKVAMVEIAVVAGKVARKVCHKPHHKRRAMQMLDSRC